MAVYKPTARANVTAGDVVVHDVDNDNSVITTTVAGAESVAGVCAETIASGNPCIVESDGDFVTVNVAAGTVRGQFLVTHTVAGQAIGVPSWRVGVFGYTRSDIGTPAAGQCYAVINIGMPDYAELHAVPGSAAFAGFSCRRFTADVSSLAATSRLHITDFSIVGATAGEVTAIGTNPGIAVFHQHAGVFVTPSQTEYAARFPDGGAWADGIDGETIFVADDDAIYIGAVGPFSLLEVVLTTTASVDPQLDFHYFNTALAWIEFSPDDETDGFRQDGIIEWVSDDFVNWKSDYDPGGADGSAGYYIRITRRRNVMATTPVPTTVKLLEPAEFELDKDGNLTVNDLTVGGTANFTLPANSVDDTHIDWGAGANQVDADDVPESATKFWVTVDGIDDTHIDWGAGANQVDADDVPESATRFWVSTDNIKNTHIDWGAGAGQVDADDVPESTTLRFSHVGNTFPGAPVEGDLFYWIDRNLQFQYSASLWVPLRSYAALVVYVDAGSGSDALGKGFTSGAGATATIQYCIDNCVPVIFGGVGSGDVTINIAAGDYAENVIIKDKVPNGDYVIKLVGTFAEVLAEATVDSGVQGTAAVQGNIVDAAPAWANDAHNGLLIVFEGDTTTAPLGDDIYVIDDTVDAGDFLYIVGTFDAQPVAGDTYTIQDWGTTIDSISLGDGQQSVELHNIHMTEQSGIALTGVHCSLQMWYSKISDPNPAVFNMVEKFSNVRADFCVIENLRARVVQGFLRLADSRMLGGAGGAVLELSPLANCSITAGTVIDADSDDVEGVLISTGSKAGWFSSAANGYPRVRNADQAGRSGILTEKTSGSDDTANIQFANNTADETTDAATFAWSN